MPRKSASDTGLPERSTASATGIPSRGASANGYARWAPVVDELRENLGTAVSYENMPNVQTEAQGIRRTFGITAVTRDFDKESKVGTLWLEYPSVLHDDGTRSENSAAVKETLEKYAK